VRCRQTAADQPACSVVVAEDQISVLSVRKSSATHRQLGSGGSSCSSSSIDRSGETTLYVDGTVRAKHATAIRCGLSCASHVAACVVETAHLPRLSSANAHASTAKNLSGATLQQPFETLTMSNWMPMERIYGTYSSWTHSPLDNDDSTTSKTSWKDTSRNLVGIRGLRRVLLALLLIIVFANRFPLRAHRGSAPLDNIDPEQFPEGVDWSQYAYCQYVTNPQYLCNSVMIFEALDRVGAKASKVMMFPSNWDITNDDDTGRLIRHAQARYNVQLSPNQVQHLSGETTWADSLTKGIVNLQKTKSTQPLQDRPNHFAS
jgi:hypothetical protein